MTASLRGHSRAESVGALSLENAGLKRALHGDYLSFVCGARSLGYWAGRFKRLVILVSGAPACAAAVIGVSGER